MKANKLAPIAMLLALLLMALPSSAENRGRNVDRHAHGDHSQCSHNPVGQTHADKRIEKISYDLIRSTRELRADYAGHRRFVRSHHRRATLRALVELDLKARDFYRSVRADGADDRNSRRAFRRLENAYATASERFPTRRYRANLRQDFAKVERLMARVETRMARLGGPGHHGRYASNQGSSRNGVASWWGR